MALTMTNFRQEVEVLLQQKQLKDVGFHHTYQVNQLIKKAKQARSLNNLMRTPIRQWKKTLADTRFVIDTLDIP